MRASIFLICLALALAAPLWSQTSTISEQELLQLRSFLLLIGDGLTMTELPLSEIESSQQQREQRLTETELDLSQREEALAQREMLLSERESALQEREKALTERETGLSNMASALTQLQSDIQASQKITKVVTIAALVTAGASLLISFLN